MTFYLPNDLTHYCNPLISKLPPVKSFIFYPCRSPVLFYHLDPPTYAYFSNHNLYSIGNSSFRPISSNNNKYLLHFPRLLLSWFETLYKGSTISDLDALHTRVDTRGLTLCNFTSAFL